MQKKIINFFDLDKPYGQFNNIFPVSFKVEDKLWPSSEHFFQAMKFQGTEKEEKIRIADSPLDAFDLGNERDKNFPLRADWEVVKEKIMHTALLAKFSQNSDLKDLLLSTEDATLVEDTINDSYWGNGGDGTGKNNLGKLLEQVRDELKQN